MALCLINGGVNMKLEIEAIMWYFGMKKKEAYKWRKEAFQGTIDAIVELYQSCAQKAFYED